MKKSHLALALCALFSGSQSALAAEGATTIDVFVDREAEPRHGDKLEIPAGTNTLRFQIKSKAPRVRFMLEGLDEEWDERSEPNLLWVRFTNRRGDIVRRFPFPVSGSSAGWKGSLEASEFTPRDVTLTVPPGAANVVVVMSSAGPAALVGTFAIKDFGVVLVPKSGEPPVTLMADSRLAENGKAAWAKSGTHPSMSSVTKLDGEGEGSPVLVITDYDVNAHADLVSIIRGPVGMKPGDTIQMSWKETYNMGLGDNFTVTYDRLPPGKYRLLVEDLTMNGNPRGSGAVVGLTVPAIFWKTPWFWVIIASVSVVVGRYLIRRRIRLHLLQEQMISEERRRIALDLHDDIGTRISHISLVASHADNTIPNEAAQKAFGQISSMSRDLIGALSETVWMLNPKNDDLESLVDFLYRLATELCRLKRIRCRVDAAFITENEPIPYDFRHNVSLAVKESINNVLKHSEATEFKMKIELHQRILTIAITDNGIGMTEESRSDGLGLANLTRRMKSIGGSCNIDQLEEGGMRIVLNAPLSRKPNRKPAA
ncbi:hypothetical protein HZ994_06660 [Akkermansiaceae bacterium]|nr:hypothetical protein HZ994_06660 [Akkermansiaceae bacterium]